MAYWGEFTALGFNKVMKEERKAAPEKAKSLAGKASDHEQYYIRAAEHEGTPDDPKEREGYQREMETLIDRHPDDLNAHAFLGLPVMGGYEQRTDPALQPGERGFESPRSTNLL